MTTPSGKHPIDPLASVTREHAGLGHPGVKPSGSVLPWLLTMPSPDAPTRANERAGAERHPAENYHNPQPAVEPGITKSENVPLDESIRAPEGLREHPDWYTADAEECHFPRAAQLPAVPGLAPIDPVPGPAPGDRFLAVARVPEQPELVGPPRATPRGKLRGPLAILIASICAVPIGYYIWMRGWSPFSDSPPGPQMASVGPTINAPRASIGHQELRLPMARDNDRGTSAPNEISSQRTETSQPAKSSEHDTVAMVQPSTNAAQTPTASKAAGALDPDEIKLLTTQGEQGPQSASVSPMINASPSSIGKQKSQPTAAREDDRGTSAPNGISSQRTETSQPAKSSDRETVAMVQPSTNAAQTPTASKAARALDPEEIKLLMKQGEQLIATGDVVTARIVFQRAAESGDANAAIALGSTYDPTVFAKLGVMGMNADVEKARDWYRKAEGLGSPDARRRLNLLANR